VVEQSFVFLPKMKNPLDYIHKYPLRTKRVLGIDYSQFLQLLEQANLKHYQHQNEVEKQKVRVNVKGGGRKPILSVAEKICLCLFYLRHYPTFEILRLHFDISKTEANDTVHYWLKLLRVLLPASLIEEKESNNSDFAIVEEWLSGFELIVDSLEQARERPEDNEEQLLFR
jgi:Helix-turn-helix of DDE superfamily endonuclease